MGVFIERAGSGNGRISRMGGRGRPHDERPRFTPRQASGGAGEGDAPVILFVSPSTLQKGLTEMLVRPVGRRISSGGDKAQTCPTRSSTSEPDFGPLRCGTLKVLQWTVAIALRTPVKQ